MELTNAAMSDDKFNIPSLIPTSVSLMVKSNFQYFPYIFPLAAWSFSSKEFQRNEGDILEIILNVSS